jgi:hypothetical protein
MLTTVKGQENTTIDLLAVANGLENVRFIKTRELIEMQRGYEPSAGKISALSFIVDSVTKQRDAVMESPEYAAQKNQLEQMNRPYSEALKSTAGLNGAQILMLNRKSA